MPSIPRHGIAAAIVGAIIFLFLSLAAGPAPAEDMESPLAALNHAQKTKADNLALTAATQYPSEYPELAAALEAVAEAEHNLLNPPEGSTMEELEAALAAAREELATQLGTTSEMIAEMRAEMGWGEIAHELGVHPSVLGLGHKWQKGKTVRTALMSQTQSGSGPLATVRNLKGGLAKGHGLSKGEAQGKALGLGAEKAKIGKGVTGQGGGKGVGQGKGKGKSEGKGKGKGHNK